MIPVRSLVFAREAIERVKASYFTADTEFHELTRKRSTRCVADCQILRHFFFFNKL